MSRNVWKRSGSGRSAGLVSADIFRPGVDDLTELGALAPNDIWDGTLIHVRSSNEVYSYDLEAVNLPDGLNVIEPATGVGRWLRIAFSGSSTATSVFADKWIDVTKITPTETITVDRTSSDDWPQEVRREEITIDGVLDVVDGYVIVGGPNLAEVLGVFNATQGIDIDVSDGDIIQYGDSPAATVAPAGKGKIRYNQATTSLQGSVDGGPWVDLGTGSGGVTVEDEGGALPGSFTTINFVGAGVTASDAGGGTANVTIPGGGGGGTITVTTDVALSAGDLVAFNSSGNVVLADPDLALSPDRYEVRGVASAGAAASASTPIYVDNGSRVPVRFAAAPAGASNGSRVYLDTTAGLATTSVPPNGNALVKVGILVGADGLTSTPDVVVDFDVIALLP